MSEKAVAHIQKETPGIDDHQIDAARRAWTDNNVLRRLLEFDIKERQDTLKTTLASAELDTVKQLQGQIAGLEAALGIIKSQEE